MVKEEDSRSEGCEFEFRARYWMDFFTIICCKICITCLKRQKINEKEAEDGPFLKKLLNGLANLNEIFRVMSLHISTFHC